MLESFVYPKVVFGSPATGAGADSLRKAFGKYNSHDHGVTYSNSFFSLPLVLGSRIEIEPSANNDFVTSRVFPLNTTLKSYTDNELVLSNPAIRTTVISSLKVGITVVSDLVVEKGSSVLKKLNRPGFVHPDTATSASTRVITNTFKIGDISKTPIIVGSLFNCRLSRLAFSVESGGASGKLIITGDYPYEFPLANSIESPTQLVDLEVNSFTNIHIKKDHSLLIEFTNVQSNTRIYYSVYLTDVIS